MSFCRRFQVLLAWLTLTVAAVGGVLSLHGDDFPRRGPGIPVDGRALLIDGPGRVGVPLRIDAAGSYTLVAVARNASNDGASCTLKAEWDGQPIGCIEVADGEWRTHTITVELPSGSAWLEFAFSGLRDQRSPAGAVLLLAVLLAPDEDQPLPEMLNAAEAAALRDRKREAMLAEADDRINHLRRGLVAVEVRQEDGTPPAGCKVRVQQQSHAFGFGCELAAEAFDGSLPEDQRQSYLEFVRGTGNLVYSREALRWTRWEPEPGSTDSALLQAILGWCEVEGMRLHSGGFLLGSEDAVPGWARDLEDGALRQAVTRRVRRVMTVYRGRIAGYDILDEPLRGRYLLRRLGAGIRRQIFHEAAAADSAARLSVSQGRLLDELWLDDFITEVQALLDDGAPIGGLSIKADFQVPGNPLDGRRFNRALDRLAELGLPLRIVEAAVAHSDPLQQAAELEALYRLAYAHPAVDGILLSNPAPRAGFQSAAAVLDYNCLPRQSAEMLSALLRDEWWTDIEGNTAPDGRFTCEAFQGAYRISAVTGDGRRAEALAVLSAGQRQTEVILRLPAREPEPVPQDAPASVPPVSAPRPEAGAADDHSSPARAERIPPARPENDAGRPDSPGGDDDLYVPVGM